MRLFSLAKRDENIISLAMTQIFSSKGALTPLRGIRSTSKDKNLLLRCLVTRPRNASVPEWCQRGRAALRDHGSALLLFATSITGKRDQAQDAVHQVFLKLIEGRKHERVSDAASSIEHCHAYQEPEGRFRIQHLDRASQEYDEKLREARAALLW